jgi:hypothetical protein
MSPLAPPRVIRAPIRRQLAGAPRPVTRLSLARAPGPVIRRALAAALLGVVATGCGQQGSQRGPAVSAQTLPVLAASAVPGIPSATVPLTAAELGKDATIRGLAAKITSWGYLGGRQRTFQGESHRLTLVVSRSLRFAGAAGAGRYVAFVRGHQSAFFGSFTQTLRLHGRGISGWLFAPPLCACHLANPSLTGVLAAGPRVTWLEINGPAATQRLLLRLLTSVHGVPPARPG